MRIEHNIANALIKYEKEHYVTYLKYVESLIKIYNPESKTKDNLGLLAIVILSMDLSNPKKQNDSFNIFKKMIEKGFSIHSQEEISDIGNDMKIIYELFRDKHHPKMFFEIFKNQNDVIALPLIYKDEIYKSANINPGLIKTKDILDTLFKYFFISSPLNYKNNTMDNYCNFLSDVIYNMHKNNPGNTFISQLKSQKGIESFFHHFGVVVRHNNTIYVQPENYNKCNGYREWLGLLQSIEKKMLNDVIDHKEEISKKKRL